MENKKGQFRPMEQMKVVVCHDFRINQMNKFFQNSTQVLKLKNMDFYFEKPALIDQPLIRLTFSSIVPVATD